MSDPDLAVSLRKVLNEIQRLQSSLLSPFVVALDGGSGSGKSTLALLIEKEVNAALIQIDDFFAADIPDTQWDLFSIEDRLKNVFDWGRLRETAIEPLLAGKPARWHTLDFESGSLPDGTYRIGSDYIEKEPADVILLDGAYSASSRLADIVNLTVLIDVPVEVRHARLTIREEKDFLNRWHMRWDPVENYYFTHVMPKSSFDLVVRGEAGD